MEKKEEKILLLLDFDGTIIDGDIIFTMFEKTLSKKDNESITDFDNLNYAESIDKYYKLMRSYNKTINDINPVLEKMKFNEGMPELFNYIKQNKNKFFVILITGDDLYPTKYFLKSKGVIELFDDFIGIPSYLADGDTMVKVNFLPPHNCDFCDESLCKNYEFLKFLEKNKKFQKNKVFYICDGWNDYCLASKFMRNNDVILAREGYEFSKMMKKKKYNKNIKSIVKYWKNGIEIIDHLKKYI